MTLILTIIKQSDPSFSEKLEFNRFPVFFGRENNNQVILSDPLKIISRKHAKIINTEGILQLLDLESANFTYLNDERILPNEENALQSGDKIKIGDYEVHVNMVKEEEIGQDDDQKTMIFSSPYSEEITNIVANLRILSSKYSLEDSPAKEKMLRLSILQNLISLDKDESNKIITECFSENFLGKEFFNVNIPKVSSVNKNFAVGEQPKIIPSANNNYSSKPLAQEYSFNIHFSNTLDVFLEVFTKLIEGLLQFRQEFFGVTKYYSLPTGSVEEIKEFLFNPDISPDEEKKRLDMLKDEAQKLLGHQIGLLEGYNLSVTEGSKMMLQSLDPNIIEKGFQSKKASDKILSFAKKSKILDLIKENYQKYISDLYYIEKKFFRPSFMRGYQKRM
ncbi:MAG: FHA domain-containing protein [Ignavibacteriaceae bacterium]